MPGVSTALRSSLSALGVRIVDTKPFDGHPYCNKIQQCFSGAFDGYEKVVLTDCDVFFLRPLRIPESGIFAGKVVDTENPPLAILRRVYEEAGVAPRSIAAVSCPLSDAEQTYASNLNGGMYVMDAALLPNIGRHWKRWATWLIERIGLLERYRMHVDQIALALALDELAIDVTALRIEDNFPVHLPRERLAALRANGIGVLHYHSSVGTMSGIKETGINDIDVHIRSANEAIERIIAQDFDNELFWNWRYACFPELGSGIGSRGEILQYKRGLLQNATIDFHDSTVLDVGCGDLETTRHLPLTRYTGMDLSDEALPIAAAKRPDWRFVKGSAADAGEADRADLVLCLDLLIHQKTRSDYISAVHGLATATEKRLIISGYEEPPAPSTIIAFHEPLSVTLRQTGAFNEILCIGKYRDVSLFVADKSPSGAKRHISDVPREVFDTMAPLVPRPDLLLALMDESRKSFGFFTQTSIRMLEYPWMLEKIVDWSPHAAVLDIGAGLSPLPIMLARLGISVDCVDSHPTIRRADTRHQWNEWGFIDYGQFHDNLRAFHTDVLNFQPTRRYDVVYSLSVIEHMPRAVREKTIALAGNWLSPGGLLLLTVDVVPGTVDLWNLSEGRTVDTAPHGTLEDLGRELKAAGFSVEEAVLRSNIPFSRTDVAFIVARR
jgi:2-polyprenyl-3-methyl-5-hydroxy-6-metoxy-1,4-benzoquinol methylase